MKILYILSHLNRIAPNTVIINLLMELKEKNIDVFILSLNHSKNDNYKDLLEKNKINYKEYQSTVIALKDFEKNKSLIKKYDIIHVQDFNPNLFISIYKAFMSNIKVINTVHSEADNELKVNGLEFSFSRKIKSYTRLYILNKLYKYSNKVVAVSKTTSFYLDRININNSIIYNGIPISRNFIDKNRNKVINICQIGIVNNLKNQLFTLRLIKYLKEQNISIKGHFFGNNQGDYFNNIIKKYIVNNKLDNQCVFYGNLKSKELFTNLEIMDFYIMPSFSEGMPLSLLEALSFSLPSIVSNNGGMKEIVNNDNGLIIDINKDNFKAIKDFLLSKDYVNLRKNAFNSVVNNYSINSMSNEYFNIYKDLLK